MKKSKKALAVLGGVCIAVMSVIPTGVSACHDEASAFEGGRNFSTFFADKDNRADSFENSFNHGAEWDKFGKPENSKQDIPAMPEKDKQNGCIKNDSDKNIADHGFGWRGDDKNNHFSGGCTGPMGEKPSCGNKPSETKPAVTKPSATKPAVTKPVVTKPSAETTTATTTTTTTVTTETTAAETEIPTDITVTVNNTEVAFSFEEAKDLYEYAKGEGVIEDIIANPTAENLFAYAVKMLTHYAVDFDSEQLETSVSDAADSISTLTEAKGAEYLIELIDKLAADVFADEDTAKDKLQVVLDTYSSMGFYPYIELV